MLFYLTFSNFKIVEVERVANHSTEHPSEYRRESFEEELFMPHYATKDLCSAHYVFTFSFSLLHGVTTVAEDRFYSITAKKSKPKNSRVRNNHHMSGRIYVSRCPSLTHLKELGRCDLKSSQELKLFQSKRKSPHTSRQENGIFRQINSAFVHSCTK